MTFCSNDFIAFKGRGVASIPIILSVNLIYISDLYFVLYNLADSPGGEDGALIDEAVCHVPRDFDKTRYGLCLV
jgi:hypothetical protein